MENSGLIFNCVMKKWPYNRGGSSERFDLNSCSWRCRINSGGESQNYGSRSPKNKNDSRVPIQWRASQEIMNESDVEYDDDDDDDDMSVESDPPWIKEYAMDEDSSEDVSQSMPTKL